MSEVLRFVTFVDLKDDGDAGPNTFRISVSARQDVVLSDGRRVVVTDDRGWVAQFGNTAWSLEDRQAAALAGGAWAHQTRWQMEEMARSVVGPDEPLDELTEADEDAAHWNALAKDLSRKGIEVTSEELEALPHDVELSERILARIRR